MKTYRKFTTVTSCRLSKIDLKRLVQLVAEHAATPDDVTISTTIGDIEIKALDLDSFLAHDDLPDVLDHIYLSAWTPHGHNSISLGGLFNTIEVTGEDETWVRGSFDRLREFLVRRQLFQPPRILASSILVSIAIGAALTLVAQLLVQGQFVYGFIASVTGSFLLLRYSSWSFFPVRQKVRIVLVERRSLWGRLMTRDNLAMIIAILGLIFTIIQTLK